jgi:hypothetical protein
MDSPRATPKGVGCPIRTSEDHRALAPPLGFSQRATSFIASRYQGIHQMPFSCCARAQPRARGFAACRDQMTEVRCQMASRPATRPALRFSDLPIPALRPLGRAQGSPADARRIGITHTHAPGPTSPRLRGDGRTCFTVTTRFTISREQRTEDSRQTRRSAACTSVTTRGPNARRRARDFCPLFSVFCHLSLPTPVVVGLGRFERPTSRLSGVRSDQLSYRPKISGQRTEIR